MPVFGILYIRFDPNCKLASEPFVTDDASIFLDSNPKLVCLLYTFLKKVICGFKLSISSPVPLELKLKLPPPIYLIIYLNIFI